MDRIRRNERLAALTEELTASPNRIHTLSSFCAQFGSAKSSLSEDVDLLKGIFSTLGLGEIATVPGAAGGVRFRPKMTREAAREFLEKISGELQTGSRLLPGGFLYLGDLLSMPEIVRKMGIILAGEYYDREPDFVLTMETRGIPVALMVAQSLGVPLAIARHTSKAYEGPAVNINYVSGSSNQIETMSLSRRAVKEGQKALIVDDFLKAGGTARGMMDLMAEFRVEVVGCAFVMEKSGMAKKMITGEKSLMVFTAPENEGDELSVRPADWLTRE